MSLFTETSKSSEKIISNIKKGDFTDIFENFIKIEHNHITIHYIYFKHFASNSTYDFLTSLITNKIDPIINQYNNFIVHFNVKTFSLIEMDKHKSYIYSISNHFKEKYPNKLEKCYIYNSSFLLNQLYNLVSSFVDKETIKKIEFI
uniref:CRAL-TRIO domain-containing protein n=1 Tax=viral metagenome TaxID=1070528 RepID=A0A6C0IT90_9ZZZZ